ncbi:NAD(P)/FAD-dependent oxidoreductase [Terricaulis silvestris]|uniref:Glycine oxidase n=1 Tax=Terricaulis silvestris TaxID=2686094 RepID=A0A6I6MV27_9CAUL|nr:FAD-binding oxidoreductase [Terricaulis silvestris]QGZ96617.1 Glycine oxidase [Terricaulis silvestris]
MAFDAVIAGGGIIGCCAAQALCDIGCRVMIVEARENLLTATSAAGFGSLTPFSDPFFDGDIAEFANQSVRLYRNNIVPEFARHSRLDFVDEGLLQLFASMDDLEESRSAAKGCAGALRGPNPLSRMEVLALEPALRGDFAGALLYDEPWIDLEQLLQSVKDRLARNPKCTIKLKTRVDSVDTDASAVCLDTGERVAAGEIVLATGLGETAVLGFPRPEMEWIRGEGLRVRLPADSPHLLRHVYHGKGFVTPRMDGTCLLGSTYVLEEPRSIGETDRAKESIRATTEADVTEACAAFLPQVRRSEVLRRWSGWRPRSRDHFPILGRLVEGEGPILALGFLGLGVTMAPRVGQVVAEMVATGTTAAIPSRMLAARFNQIDTRPPGSGVKPV